MNLEELVIASGFSICKVTGAWWSGGVSCRRELEKFAELVRGEVWEMNHCEAESVSLHPGVLYRFKVAPDCPKCNELAEDHAPTFCPPECDLKEQP